jgi:hypothetical protein
MDDRLAEASRRPTTTISDGKHAPSHGSNPHHENRSARPYGAALVRQRYCVRRAATACLQRHRPRAVGFRDRAALVGGSIAALATALGTVPVLLSQQFSQRAYDSMLGFGAGVMLAASSFSLVIPALAAAKSQGAGPWGSGGIVGGGLLVGALALLLIERLVPHEHFVKGLEGPEARAVKRVWLFVLAIVLHNLPRVWPSGSRSQAPTPSARRR